MTNDKIELRQKFKEIDISDPSNLTAEEFEACSCYMEKKHD